MEFVLETLWTWRQLCAALNLPPAAGPEVGGVGIDSRSLVAGDLFVALPGDPGPRFKASSTSSRDGHDYIGHAARQGASGALVHRGGDHGGLPVLRVEDTLDGLWSIARHRRRELDGAVVAVTGSSGKTTLKGFLAEALGAFATEGSLNNHIGVPLSLARTPSGAGAAVYEIGMNHPGEIAPLSSLAAPDVAVVLNVHPAHIEFFDGIEAIRREKLSIAEGLGGDGVLVHAAELDAGHVRRRRLTFGASADADVRIAGFDGGAVTLDTPRGEATAPVPGGGRHRAASVAACAAVLVALEEPLTRLARLGEIGVPRGRGNRLSAAGVTLIDDSYNANPASMAAALAALAGAPAGSGRRVAVLGEMLELGAAAPRYHRELAAACAGIDGVFCVGAGTAPLYDALPASRRMGFAEEAGPTFVRRCAEGLRAGDSVLVKGSNRVFWANGFVDALRRELAGEEEVEGER